MKLTEKQRRFAEAYVGEAKGNGALAARLAGYKGTPKVLSVMGAENLAKPAIAAFIEEARSKLSSQAIATREERQKLLTELMRDDDIEARDRIKACVELAKMQGDYIERHDVKHESTSRIVFEVDGRGPTPDQLKSQGDG